MKPSREIRNLVLGFYHDMSTSGTSGLQFISTSEHANMFGTGPGEFWLGGNAVRTALQVQAELVGAIQMTPGMLLAFEEGTVGWAVDESTMTLPDGTSSTVRLTFVFHREGNEWTMVHGHASQAADVPEAFADLVDLTMETIARQVEHDRPDLSPVASPEGTVTMVFTDIEASTAVNESVGDDRFLPVLAEHHRVLTSTTKAHGGVVVKSAGDGFLLAFPSARRALECAIGIQRDLVHIGSEEIPIRVRMGMHTGEPTRMADDFYGRDVAYAARLGSAASGGEILVSALVKSLTEPSGSFTFKGPRELEFKGFDGVQPAYEVVW